MRPVPAILIFLALLIALDYVANDGDLVRDVVDWLIRALRDAAFVIRSFVMAVFGE